MVSPGGAIISAPSSGSGKTTITLALLRALSRRHFSVSSFKIGPDYIDPAFHTAASGRDCLNLDLWAMRSMTVNALFQEISSNVDIVLGEGVMGLFDGAQNNTPRGTASTADAAELLNLPVILVIDASKQGQSIAATVQGFVNFRDDIDIAGIILNRIGSTRHIDLLKKALKPLGIPVLGGLPRADIRDLPQRHLGLIQAREIPLLEDFLEKAADLVEAHLDLSSLCNLLNVCRPHDKGTDSIPVPPIGMRIALAYDDAFQFCYGHIIEGWRSAGAQIAMFSPLADEEPEFGADAIFLPGGYPELFVEKLSSNHGFFRGLTAAQSRGATIYGECGGFMVLGDVITDLKGKAHKMAGLLPVETSFKEKKLHLGYRDAQTVAKTKLGLKATRYGAHEFHYASVKKRADTEPLFQVSDASGTELEPAGMRLGNTMGSFLHLIDRR